VDTWAISFEGLSVKDGEVRFVRFSSQARSLYIGTAAGVYKSDDGGKTWLKKWQDALPLPHSLLSLDTDPEFPAPVIDQSTDQPQVTIERPVASSYYFRVQAIDDTGYASPWSPTQAFTVPGSPWQLLVPFGMLLSRLIIVTASSAVFAVTVI